MMKGNLMRRWTVFVSLASCSVFSTLAGCVGKIPGDWRPATPRDLEILHDTYTFDAADREVLRRDVTVWFIGPASGYPEWGVKRADGTVEIVAPPKSRSE